MDLEKNNTLNGRQKEEYNKLTNDFNGLQVEKSNCFRIVNFSSQDMYDKTAIELAKTKEVEAKLKEDFERSQFDLEMCRERFDKCQVRSSDKNTFQPSAAQPFAETNTNYLGSLIQLSYQGISVARPSIAVAALSRESLVIWVFFHLYLPLLLWPTRREIE